VDIATRLNDELSENNESYMFVTMFIGLVNLTTGHLYFCNCGHNAPVIGGDADGGHFLEMAPNVSIGLWAEAVFVGEEIDSIANRPLFIYTDGLNEAENPELQQFGDDQLLKCLRATRFKSSKQVIDNMQNHVEQHRAGAEPNDDLTMMCLNLKL
jgi:serine phosphatase RsbU (regulator of sigma subunit)